MARVGALLGRFMVHSLLHQTQARNSPSKLARGLKRQANLNHEHQGRRRRRVGARQVRSSGLG